MAVPKVFISSTCKDLKFVRSHLKSLIESMGYEPILSEYGDVFYNPEEHTHDSCLNEIENCQMFILIIGGRYGGRYKESEKSITVKEYEKAFEKNIAIFTLIDYEVYKEHHFYSINKKDPNVDIDKVHFPSVDSHKTFDFIDTVRKQLKNNAIHPFNDLSDIDNYIKTQIGGLFLSFFKKAIDEGKKSENIDLILNENSNVNYLPSQLLTITGSDKAEVIFKNTIRKKHSHVLKNNLTKDSDIEKKKQESDLLANITETQFSSDTWINPLTDLCLEYLKFLQKKPGGQYLCFKKTLIGTEKEPGEIIKEYNRSIVLLRERLSINYIDRHKIAALYIRSFLKYCPFYFDVPVNIKYFESCLYTQLSNEYFSLPFLSAILKSFSSDFDKILRIDATYKDNFIKLLYRYKKNIDLLDPLALANIIDLIERCYFINNKKG